MRCSHLAEPYKTPRIRHRSIREDDMRCLVLIAAASFFTLTAAAADPTCQDQADAKKLAGAAATSFMTKCEKDAAASCQKTSADKKLSGAAKTSFETKCVKDQVGKKS